MNYLERWPEPVDGAGVLYEIEAQLRRYVSMPAGSPELVALWVMFTWAIDASQMSYAGNWVTRLIRRRGEPAIL